MADEADEALVMQINRKLEDRYKSTGRSGGLASGSSCQMCSKHNKMKQRLFTIEV